MTTTSKGASTRSAILGEAAEMASRVGLGGLTIGTLAGHLNLSKSGLYAHFGSKEDLQLEVLRHIRERFIDVVIRPTLATPRGEPRVRALFDHWLAWQDGGFSGGCPFVDAASEFDDQQGPVRDELVRSERDKLEAVATIVGTAVSEGHVREDVDTWQFAFDLQGLMLGHHHARRLLHDAAADDRARRAFERLIADAKGDH